VEHVGEVHHRHVTPPPIVRSVSVVQPASDTASSSTYAPTYTLGADSVVTSYGYDPTYGYRNSVTTSGQNVTARTTTTAIDFVNNTVTTTNALGHQEIQIIDPKFGVPLSLLGPNQIGTAYKTRWEYDGFGRKKKEIRVDGTYMTIEYTDCGSPGCWVDTDPDTYANRYARYKITTRNYGANATKTSAAAIVYYDILGREMRAVTTDFNGTAVYKDTTYDALGRVRRSSGNYFSGSTAPWTRYSYNALGRVYDVTGPDGYITQTRYSANSVTVTLPSSDGNVRKRAQHHH
jgi:hypothetical protein